MAKILITLLVWCLAVVHGRSFFWNGPFSRSINNGGERIVASPMSPGLMPCTHGYASSMVSPAPAYPSRYPVPQSAAMPSPYPLVYYIQQPTYMTSAPAAAQAQATITTTADTISANIVEPVNGPVPNSGGIAEELQYTFTQPAANLVPATPMSPMTGAGDATALLYSNPGSRPITTMSGMTGNDAAYANAVSSASAMPLPVNEEIQYQYNNYAPAVPAAPVVPVVPAAVPSRPVAMTGADTSYYYSNAAWTRPTTNFAGADASSYMYYSPVSSRPVTAMTGADNAFLSQNPMSPGFASTTFEKQKPQVSQVQTQTATLPPATSLVEQQLPGSTVKPPSGGTFPGITVPSFPTNTWQNYLCNVFPYLPSCGRNGTVGQAGETPNILTHGYQVQPSATTLVTTHQLPTGPAGPITPVAFYPPSSATSMYPYGYSPYYTQMAQNPVYYYVQPEFRPYENPIPGVASSIGTIKVIGPQTYRPEQVPIHMQDSIRPIPGPKPVDPDTMTLAEAKAQAQADQPSHSHFDNLEDIETQEGQSITYSKTPATA